MERGEKGGGEGKGRERRGQERGVEEEKRRKGRKGGKGEKEINKFFLNTFQLLYLYNLKCLMS